MKTALCNFLDRKPIKTQKSTGEKNPIGTLKEPADSSHSTHPLSGVGSCVGEGAGSGCERTGPCVRAGQTVGGGEPSSLWKSLLIVAGGSARTRPQCGSPFPRPPDAPTGPDQRPPRPAHRSLCRDWSLPAERLRVRTLQRAPHAPGLLRADDPQDAVSSEPLPPAVAV